jgi:alpha-ribazole phosphatase
VKLLLVRHPAPAIDRGICYGRLDVGLLPDSGAAVGEIAAAVRRLGVRTIWSSPAARCLVPAQAAADSIGAELRIDARLRELDFGAWEGVRWAALCRSELDRWAADPIGFAPPGGETGGALLERVTALFHDLVATETDCAVISHGGPLRVLIALARGELPDLLAPPPAFAGMLAINWPPAG